MNADKLLSSTVEFALDGIEKRDDFIPFCKAIAESREVFWLCFESEEPYTVEQAAEAVRQLALREIVARGLVGVVYCEHVRIRYAGTSERLPAIRVESHWRGHAASLYHFPYRMADGVARISHFDRSELDDDWFKKLGL